LDDRAKKIIPILSEFHESDDEKLWYEKKEIVNTETSFSESKSNFIFANSDGFMNGYKTSNFTASCVAVSKKNESMEKNGESF